MSNHDFNVLCLPHYNSLVTFATKRTRGNHAKALDIVQDSMVKAWKAWPRWVPQGDPQLCARAWLYRIVSNMFKMRYVSEKTFSRITEPGTPTATQVAGELFQDLSPAHPYTKVDHLGDEVREALERIKPEFADVIKLIYLEGMLEHQAAAELGVPYGTVRSRHARGRMALARILGPYAKQRFGYEVKQAECKEVVDSYYEDDHDFRQPEGATDLHRCPVPAA